MKLSERMAFPIDGPLKKPIITIGELTIVLWRIEVRKLEAVVEAAKILVEDEESQVGGWGPDMTMLIPLRNALADLEDGE